MQVGKEFPLIFFVHILTWMNNCYLIPPQYFFLPVIVC